MRIAVCSKDGSVVDLHFGKTTVFSIFDMDNGKQVQVDKRITPALSPFAGYARETSEIHDFDALIFEEIYSKIKDCQQLYTVSIGDKPAKLLKERGVNVKICKCNVNEIMTCNGKCH